MKKIVSFFKRFLPAFIMLTIAFSVILVGNFLDNKNASALAGQNKILQDLNTEAERLSLSLKSKDVDRVSSVSFLDSNRVLNDDHIATDFLESCFDWSSVGEYDTLYSDLYSVYGARGGSVFSIIMPEGDPFKRHYKIHPSDVIKSISMNSFRSYVVRVLDNNYSGLLNPQ